MIHTSKIGFSLALIHQKDIIQSNSCNAFRVTVHWKYLCHRSEHLEKANAYGCCGTCKKKNIYIYGETERKAGKEWHRSFCGWLCFVHGGQTRRAAFWSPQTRRSTALLSRRQSPASRTLDQKPVFTASLLLAVGTL